MIYLSVDKLRYDIDLLNFYRGEAAKRGDADADVVQSSVDDSKLMLFLIRDAAEDVLILCNTGSIKMTMEMTEEGLSFDITPIRSDKEHLYRVLCIAIRKYIIAFVRFRWMMTVRPAWADGSTMNELKDKIIEYVRSMSGGERVRRRSTNLAGI